MVRQPSPWYKKFLPHRVSWVVVSILLVAATTTFAAGDASSSTLLNNIYFFMSSIVIGIVQFVGNFTALMIHLLVIVSSYNEFINVPVVQTGWAIVRDITNMFFIIALLVIAAGTVLRIENYRYNRLLAKVIIMAFLVQFSRLITGFLIQSAQVVTLTFVNSYREVFFGNIANLFGLKQVLSLADQTLQQSAAGLSQIFISLLAGLTLMVVAFIVTLAIVIIFAIRIIALWILTILSPLAYALRILPNTEGFAKRWWSDFGKYVTIGPVLAFVLWLSLALISSTSPGAGISSKFNDTLGDAGTKYAQDNSVGSGFSSEITAIPNLLSFLVGVIFLIMGLQYASSLGGAAGQIAGSFSKAATGAALGTSGIAWLRDRTVAPVQKYWEARQERNRDTVKRRAASLGYGIDRVQSATIGQAGRALHGVREAAGSAASQALQEGGRIAGQAAGVAGQVARTAGRQAQRLASGARGGLVTPQEAAQYRAAGQAAQRAAGQVPQAGQRIGQQGRDAFVGGFAEGPRSEQERQERIGQHEANREAEAGRLAQFENMTPEQIQAIMMHSANRYYAAAAAEYGMKQGKVNLNDQAQRDRAIDLARQFQTNTEINKRLSDGFEKAAERPQTLDQTLRIVLGNQQATTEMRYAAGQRLGKRRRLVAADVNPMLNLAGQLGPDKETDFRKTLYERQGDLAIEALHNNLATVQDAQDLSAAIDRDEAKQSIIKENHLQNPAVRQALGQANYEMHQNKGTLDKMREGLSDRVNDLLYQDINVADGTDVDDRRKIANASGAIHRAFRDAAGNMTQALSQQLQAYLSRNAQKAAESISEYALNDDELTDQLAASRDFRSSHFVTIANRNGAMQRATNAALDHAYARSVQQNGRQEYNPRNQAVYDPQQKLRQSRFYVNRGDLSSVAQPGLNYFEVNNANPQIAQQAQQAMAEVVAGAEGGQVSRVDRWDIYQNNPQVAQTTRDILGRNLRYEQAGAFAAGNINLARQTMQQLPAGTQRTTYQNSPNTAFFY